MPTAHHPTTLACLALIASAVLIAPPAWAGCGCDHPPPAWSLVMPPFGSPGTTITLWGAYEPGTTYSVSFGSRKKTVRVRATNTNHLEVSVPPGVPPGPVALKVTARRFRYTFARDLFTVLAPPQAIQPGTAVNFFDLQVAIAEDGTLLIPFDVPDVIDATQLAFRFEDLRLAFGHDDVVFYNADGFDLTLFTLDVTSATELQWGSYYGWEVEDDTGLMGAVYDTKVQGSSKPAVVSDLVTYWRHEFYTYATAHGPAGTHKTDATGFFHLSNGTRHVDHYSLVLAISGLERDSRDPDNARRWKPLSPGNKTVTVGLATVVSDTPIEPVWMAAVIDAAATAQ